MSKRRDPAACQPNVPRDETWTFSVGETSMEGRGEVVPNPSVVLVDHLGPSRYTRPDPTPPSLLEETILSHSLTVWTGSGQSQEQQETFPCRRPRLCIPPLQGARWALKLVPRATREVYLGYRWPDEESVERLLLSLLRGRPMISRCLNLLEQYRYTRSEIIRHRSKGSPRPHTLW